MNTLLNAEQVRMNVSIVRFLQCLGFIPGKRVGAELFYLSMLEESDIQFSFVVNEDHNSWYDHELGVGGDITDFVKLYWKPISHQEAILKIHVILGLPGSENIVHFKGELSSNPIKCYRIVSINEIGTSDALSNYLERQLLRSKVSGDLKEVYFKKDHHGTVDVKEPNLFFGIGWPNECGGWEIRNKYFRTCVGHKGVTFVPKSKDSVAVFSDYFSYLIWKGGFDVVKEESVIVLNHHELINAGLTIAASFQHIQLYLDRSQAGFKATRTFCRRFPQCLDRSTTYRRYLSLHACVVANLSELGTNVKS